MQADLKPVYCILIRVALHNHTLRRNLEVHSTKRVREVLNTVKNSTKKDIVYNSLTRDADRIALNWL